MYICILIQRQWRIQDFPLGGVNPLGGRRPSTRTLFGENVCENERNGSCWGRAGGAPLDPPMNDIIKFYWFISIPIYLVCLSHKTYIQYIRGLNSFNYVCLSYVHFLWDKLPWIDGQNEKITHLGNSNSFLLCVLIAALSSKGKQ